MDTEKKCAVCLIREPDCVLMVDENSGKLLCGRCYGIIQGSRKRLAEGERLGLLPRWQSQGDARPHHPSHLAQKEIPPAGTTARGETDESPKASMIPQQEDNTAGFAGQSMALRSQLLSIAYGLERARDSEDAGEKDFLLGHLSFITKGMADFIVGMVPPKGERRDALAPCNKGVVYLGVPYSDDSPDVMRARFINACQAAAFLMRRGYAVLSPISMGHPIAKYGKIDGGFETFRAACFAMMDAADSLVILNIPGWKKSVGLRAESVYAASRGMPSRLLTPAGHDFLFGERDITPACFHETAPAEGGEERV